MNRSLKVLIFPHKLMAILVRNVMFAWKRQFRGNGSNYEQVATI